MMPFTAPKHCTGLSIALALLNAITVSAGVVGNFGVVTNVSRFGSYPCWSPDSRRVVFTETNSTGIWIYDRNTGRTRQIHEPGGFPAWSPRGGEIAFRKDNQLWLIRPDGTSATNTGLAVGSGLSWSPDGRYLLTYTDQYAPHDQLLVVDTESWSTTELPFGRVGARNKVGDTSWTPEGNVMITPPLGDTGDCQANEVREYSLDGRFIRRTILKGFASKVFDARVSSDGKLIIFHRGRRGIWVANRDGTGTRQISRVGAAAAWSPDRKALVYDDSSSTPNLRNGIYIVDIDWSAK